MHQFDELAKELAKGVSRREAFRRIGGGLGGALLAAFGLVKPASAVFTVRSTCLINCSQTQQGCTRHCDLGYNANRAAALAALQGCRTGCPSPDPSDVCHRACEAQYQQSINGLEDAHTACYVHCNATADTCARACYTLP